MKTEKEFTTLLEKWIVIDMGADIENPLRVTRRENFIDSDYCHSHANYGNYVGCHDAGCYVFDNSESPIHEHFYLEASKKFGFNEDLLDRLELSYFGLYEMCMEPEHSIAYNIMLDELPNWPEIVAFFKEWKLNNEFHTKAKFWTFHDGHNFESIVLECQLFQPSEMEITEVDEEEQLRILSQMPENAPYIDRGFSTSEETEDFKFYFDLYAENPWFCFVVKK